MLRRFAQTIRQLDFLLLASMAILVTMGLLNLAAIAAKQNLFVKQSVFAAVGFLLVPLVAMFDYRRFRSSAWLGVSVWVMGVLLLLAATLFSERVRGAKNWLFLGPLSIGPVEVVKLGVLIVFAHYFARAHHELVFPRRLLSSAIFVAVPMALMLLQPDLGSAALFAMLWFSMVVLLGIPLRTLLALLLTVAIASAILWNTALHDYQRERILAFLNPTHDPSGIAYQGRQALLSIGSGGMFGRGFFAEDLHARLSFLPESTTDFAFAAIVEASGLAGAIIIFFASAVLLSRIAKIARNATNNFSCAYALGLFLLLAIETALNIGMNLRLLPVTGQPLPFVSYGGSHTLVTFVAIGLLESIRLHQPKFAIPHHEAISSVAESLLPVPSKGS